MFLFIWKESLIVFLRFGFGDLNGGQMAGKATIQNLVEPLRKGY
jgi:hypothetical protein